MLVKFSGISKYLQNPDLLEEKEDLFEMANDWYKKCKNIIQFFWKTKGLYIFHAPVNMENYGITDYYDTIKHPMDFGTIKSNLNYYQYKTPQ
jgi:hypothetical protein